MKLKLLVDQIPRDIVEVPAGIREVDLSGVTMDSREVQPGFLFVAVRGERTDGHNHIPSAIQGGAVAIVAEEGPTGIQSDVTWIQCRDSRKALGWISSIFYGHPSRKLKLVGVTGTNGKTTIATLLYRLFGKLDYKVGLISTVGNWIAGERQETAYTTPFPVQLNSMLRKMVEENCLYVFMEVSSHAIDQHRIEGLRFEGGIFTNITHDHLEYHGSFENYIGTKKKFFDNLDENAFALVNTDDRNGKVMIQNCRAKLLKYSMNTLVEYKARLIHQDVAGMQLSINEYELFSRLTGNFNAYNLLAIYGTADILLGMDEEKVRVISSLAFVEGRFQVVQNINRKITAVVDYAHTPNALENVLMTIKDIKRKSFVITVVGCGGDRDKAKRPLMARISVRYSDVSVFTSDNPRSEDPNRIIEDMMDGLSDTDSRKVVRIVDRREAISSAVRMAQRGSVILVAGKGHEKYQESKGVKTPFDDMEILKALLLEDIKE